MPHLPPAATAVRRIHWSRHAVIGQVVTACRAHSNGWTANGRTGGPSAAARPLARAAGRWAAGPARARRLTRGVFLARVRGLPLGGLPLGRLLLGGLLLDDL